MEKEKFLTNHENEVTFKNLIQEGKEIIVEGSKVKIEKIEGPLTPNNGRGGFYRITVQPIDGSLSFQLQVTGDESEDWYILYQNGKK